MGRTYFAFKAFAPKDKQKVSSRSKDNDKQLTGRTNSLQQTLSSKFEYGSRELMCNTSVKDLKLIGKR